jgi:cytochrome b561
MKPALHRYTSVAITLHWLIATAILGTFLAAQYMTELQLSSDQAEAVFLPQVDRRHDFPACADPSRLACLAPPTSAAGIDASLAAQRREHRPFFLYALTLRIPVSGWLMSSASGFQVVYLGLLPIRLARQEQGPGGTTEATARGVELAHAAGRCAACGCRTEAPPRGPRRRPEAHVAFPQTTECPQ